MTALSQIDWGKFCKRLTIGLLIVLIVWGACMVAFEIKPFWIDEWRLLYNLKFKSVAALWGPLEYTQQFPRVFLQVLKQFTSSLNYSYFSLRFPAFFVSVCSILLLWHLLKKIFPSQGVASFLFILITVSSQTFTDYLVQIKQYEMEIFLSLVAIWQMLALTEIREDKQLKLLLYLLLCLSFCFAPFFSYTYPIAMAPIYVIVTLQDIQWAKHKKLDKITWLRWLPLILGGISTIIFYLIDVRQLMHDKEMHNYWSYRMAAEGSSALGYAEKLWGLFAKVGSGFVFEVIFGALGICSFVYAVKFFIRSFSGRLNKQGWLSNYVVVLIFIVIALFLAGKLPLSEPKFNAFTVPGIALLIIYFINLLARHDRHKKWAIGVLILLYTGLTGNILSTMANTFTAPTYLQRISTYKITEAMIAKAQKENIPLVVTPAVAFPDDIVNVAPYLTVVPAHVVLMTFPAYDVKQKLPVYTTTELPPTTAILNITGTSKAYVGNGTMYFLIDRDSSTVQPTSLQLQ